MAKLVDIQGHWAAAIGKAFVAFGSIEHTTVVCLKQIPRDRIQRFSKSLKLSQRIDLLLELLESHDLPECSVLADRLRQAKSLVPTRNLIAHNPLVLEFYEQANGGYAFAEAIAAIHREGHKITLQEAQEFAALSEKLASELIDSSLKAFRAMGITAGT